MELRIADTFTDSLAMLTGEEQKAVKTTAFDLQLNPANPGMQFHKLDRARDKNTPSTPLVGGSLNCTSAVRISPRGMRSNNCLEKQPARSMGRGSVCISCCRSGKTS